VTGKRGRVVGQVAGFLALGLVGLAFIGLGLWEVRNNGGAQVSINRYGQSTMPAFMISGGAAILIVLLIALIAWVRQRLLLRLLRTGRGGAGRP
jgi:hypothetical protein